MRVLVLALALVAVGCGRLRFAELDGDALGASADQSLGDGAPPPGSPPSAIARFPWNGYMTGSLHGVPGVLVKKPLHPQFTWEPNPEASYHELQLDDSCSTASFVTCTFPTPELDMRVDAPRTAYLVNASLSVATTPPVGRRYFWRLRACNDNGCSAWTRVRYVDVGRVPDDWNGDGYSDLTISESGLNLVHVFPGSAAGFTEPAAQSITVVAGELVSAGDVDADGFPDLVTGTYANLSAYLLRGSATGLAAPIAIDPPAPQAGERFACSVAGGDLDGDGYADVIVGAFGRSNPETSEGNAFIFSGSATGLVTATPTILDSSTGAANGGFANKVSSGGDVDGDGFVDLIVGAYNPSGGGAQIFPGSATGVSHTTRYALPSIGGSDLGDSVAILGDVNHDGLADVAAADDQNGSVHIFPGDRAGVAATPIGSYTTRGFSFGTSMANLRDIDGDGFDDTAVAGAYLSNPETGEGTVSILYGSSGALVEVILDNPLDQAGAHYGSSVAGIDIDGNCLSDVAIGARDTATPRTAEGNAFVFLGGLSGLAVTPTIMDSPSNTTSAAFGTGIAGGAH